MLSKNITRGSWYKLTDKNFTIHKSIREIGRRNLCNETAGWKIVEALNFDSVIY